MAVDLSDLIPSLDRAVTVPGGTLDIPNSMKTGYLSDGFWAATLDGLITGYTEEDGIVTPTSGDTDLPRETQQLVVFYAGYRIVQNQLLNTNTVFRTKAGPVEYETQQAASMLKAIMDDLTRQREHLLEYLNVNGTTSTYYYDAVDGRSASIYYEDTSWVGY